MRKIIQFNMMTLDGFFEGPNQDINWHNVDDEFNEFAIEQLESAGALIFGRVTYELMAGYWSTPEAIASDPVVAGWMNKLHKFVFSKTLPMVDWQNTTLIKGDAAQELNILKQQPGKDFFIFGSADLSETLFRYSLIDEIRVMVNPLILGSGTVLFKPRRQEIPLTLLKVKSFQNGNVLLYYQVQRHPM